MRRISRSPLLMAAALLVASVALAGCFHSDEKDKATFSLTIGDLVPLTGDLSDFGPPGRKAADLAVKEINKAVDEVGADHTVAVKHEDTQTDPQASVQAARKLVNAQNASCLAGAWASADTIPVAKSVSIREKVLQISPASTSDEITGLQDNDLVNRTAPPDSFQGPALAGAMDQDLGGAQGKTVNIGARNDAYGTGLAGTFEEAWKEKGGKVGEKVVYDPEQPSYNSEATKITSGGPDAFVVVDFPETYQKVGPALVRTGDWDATKTFVTDGLASGSLPKDAGEEATEGMRGTAPGAPDEGSASEAFDTLFEQSAPKDVERQTFDAQNFDAVILCYLAAVAAGEADGAAMAAEVRDLSGPPGDKFTWEQLSDAIEAIENGDDIDYEGASGPIDMNEDGDASAGVYDLFRYKDGELDVFDEVEIPRDGEGEGDE